MKVGKRLWQNRKERKEWARRLRSDDPGLEVVHPHAAGIDVGNSAHYVAVRPDRDPEPVRRFECFTADLHRLANWLQSCGVKTVALQSTGVYWIPLYEILEDHGFEVYLVNARHTKNLPGRKSDVQESQWLLKLHTYGLLSNSFQPPSEIRVLRTYWRQRAEHVSGAATCIQRMQKALTQMNLQLANVISDLSGTTGQAILRAIVAGERNARKLAELSHPRIEASREEIAKSLEGNWRPELVFVLRQEVAMYDTYQRRIAECDQQLQKHLGSFADTMLPQSTETELKKKKATKNAPRFDLGSELQRITGVDLTRIDGIDVMVAQTLLSEVGMDMSRWKTEAHFSSWLGLCPDNRISGDKLLGKGTRHVVNRAATALRLAARNLIRSRSYLGAQYRRLRTKLGAPKAITAMAHRLARLVYRMLKYGQRYVDKGTEYYENRYRQQQIHLIQKRAAKLGLQVTV
ncbi:MAG TPA: IS110 family transposase, partial [Candidatus Acidoferrales bacterium]|nr:IS110 family transposase [Candidatus Acidoferrales bacterium]